MSMKKLGILFLGIITQPYTVTSFLVYCFDFCHLLPSSIHSAVTGVQFHARCFNLYFPSIFSSLYDQIAS